MYILNRFVFKSLVANFKFGSAKPPELPVHGVIAFVHRCDIKLCIPIKFCIPSHNLTGDTESDSPTCHILYPHTLFEDTLSDATPANTESQLVIALSHISDHLPSPHHLPPLRLGT